MSEQHRITLSDLAVGLPLPWNVYDATGQLLLSKGHKVERSRQIEMLIERGMFVDKRMLRKAPPLEMPKAKFSALRTINIAHSRLTSVLFNLSGQNDAKAELLDIAGSLEKACAIDADVALGCILLNQESADYPVRHCVDTAIVSILIARSLAKTPQEIEIIAAAALTMNVAMLHLQEKLQETKGRLSEEEIRLVRNHTKAGVRQLRDAGVDNEDWLDCVLLHHENEDGSGYPFGKSGIDIRTGAKIISIADRYCARVSLRSYRKQMLPNAAMRDILVSEKDSLDPVLKTTFIRELGVYPIGTHVRLENGEIGIVTRRGESSTTPVVHSLIGPRGAPLALPLVRDTSRKNLYGIRDILHPEEANVRFAMRQLWGEAAAA